MTADNNEDLEHLRSMLDHEIERLFSVLEPDEATVIKLRFGLVGDVEKSVDEVSAELGLSVDEIVRLEQSALEKLRLPG